jgi:hypothetical protein
MKEKFPDQYKYGALLLLPSENVELALIVFSVFYSRLTFFCGNKNPQITQFVIVGPWKSRHTCAEWVLANSGPAKGVGAPSTCTD